MSIDLTAGFNVTVKSIVGGESCFNVLQYYTDDAAPSQATPTEFIDEWEDTILPLWQAVISSYAKVVQITVDPTIPTGQGYTPYAPVTRSYNAIGSVLSEVLPPYASWRLYKVPNVDAQDPATPVQTWRNGMVRIAGVAESDQNEGVATAGALIGLTSLADALGVINAGGLDHILYWRRLIGGDYFYMPAIGVIPGSILGTQNTRKIAA